MFDRRVWNKTRLDSIMVYITHRCHKSVWFLVIQSRLEKIDDLKNVQVETCTIKRG